MQQLRAGVDGAVRPFRVEKSTAVATRSIVADVRELHAVHRVRIVGNAVRCSSVVSRKSATRGRASACQRLRGELSCGRRDRQLARRASLPAASRCAPARPAGIRRASAGLSTSVTTCVASPSSMTPRLERSGLDLFRDREKRERKIDHDAAERDVGRDAVLIGVRSDDVARSSSRARPERRRARRHQHSGRSRRRPATICASACSFPALTSSQLPMYDVTTLIAGLTRVRALLERVEALDDRRQLRAADHADLVGLRHRRGEDAGEVRGVGEPERRFRRGSVRQSCRRS